MENRLFTRCRLFAAVAVLATVVCATSVAFAFTDIPGLSNPEVLLRNTDFQGQLFGGTSDQNHAVRMLFLSAGDTIDLEVDGSVGTELGISVFTDEALSVLSSEPYDSTGTGASPRTLTFVPPYTGIYYVDAYTSQGGTSGIYALRVTQRRVSTDLTVMPVANLTYGSTTQIMGFVIGGFEGEVPAGDVVLSYSFDGLFYMPLRSQALNDGGFEFDDISPLQKMYYKVQYLGSSDFNASADKGTISTTARLSGVSAKRYATRSYALAGTLNPGLQEGSPAAAVRVYLWRYVSGHWKAAGYRTAKASGADVAKYSTNYKFPYAGKWRMRAYHSDSDHLPTWSGYTYVTVK